MRWLFICLINFYQRFVSPYKGFRCAHAVYHSGPSCSNAVKSIIKDYGIIKGRPLIKARFAECRSAYLQIVAQQQDSREKDKKSNRRKKDREWCHYDCCPNPCDLADLMPKPCRFGGDGGSHCDLNPCDSGPCDAGPCDCSP